MRLHRLSITAFGPFAGSEDVDLDSLASCGLFLIHGPTGAGKTSILDAICFALYACVPGARTGARASLRSDHAPLGAVPEVTLEFTAGGRRLRVCRSPEFSRPKKRGTGQTTVPAKVVLDELLGADWSNIGTRNDEVALALKDILGMGLEQFIKVVLLPQGDFAAFLRASPEERRSVLERLFDTQRFADVEKWLTERRRQTASAVGAARNALSTALVRVDDVIARLDSGDEIIAPDWEALQEPDSSPGIESVLTALADAVDVRASTALASLDAARSIVRQTELAVHQGAAVLRHQETATQARTCLDELDSQQGVYQEAVRCVELSERANGVDGFVAAAHSADQSLTVALAEVTQLREPLEPILKQGFASSTIASSNIASSNFVDNDCFEQPGGAAWRPTETGDAAQPSAEHGGPDQDREIRFVGSLIDQMVAHSEGLQQAVVRHGEAQKLAQESGRHHKDALTAEAESSAVDLLRAKAEASRAAAETSRDASRSALAAIPALESRHASLLRIRQLVDDQNRSTDHLGVLQSQADAAHALFLDTRERLLDLRERRLAGLAAELADGLGDDQPCPVCGSCEHPSLARTSDVVSLTDVELAEAHQTDANERLSRVRASISAELAHQKARAAELETHSTGTHSELFREKPLSAAAVLDALLVMERSLDDARSAAADLPAAQAELSALTLEVERLRVLHETSCATRKSSLALAASANAQSQQAGAEASGLIAHHGLACPCQVRQPSGHAEVAEGADVAERVEVAEPDGGLVLGETQVPGEVNGRVEAAAVKARHSGILDQLRVLAGRLRELASHRTNAEDCALRLTTALQSSGFESPAQVQAATLPPARVAEFTTLLRAVEQQRAQASALLAQADVLSALKVAAPDVDALGGAHKQASANLDEAGRRHTLSEQAARELRALSVTVQRALADLGPAHQEAQLVQQLADCFAGNSPDNALRMRLSSYVLASRLAEIADLANERLTTMSDGRYTLEYTDARAAKGARSGLGLLVRDAWTGRTRETSSLSGGEAFMASLALALGMGDAVGAEAGGFDLQTLFVDEGFGSLDEESLEQVMAVLDTLREGGRAVGIVSHVAELRTRIPHQLLVLKQQAGSRIRIESTDNPAA
jgi:exonuclease SbcC